MVRMADSVLSDLGAMVSIGVGVIGAGATVFGLWLSHRTKQKDRIIEKENLELQKEKQLLDKKRFELEEKENLLKEINETRQLSMNPEIRRSRYVLYEAYHKFTHTGLIEIFDTAEYREARALVMRELETLGHRIKSHALSLDALSDSDWRIIMYCHNAIEQYNEEYKKKNGEDYYSGVYKFLVQQAKEYWKREKPEATFKPPTQRLSD